MIKRIVITRQGDGLRPYPNTEKQEDVELVIGDCVGFHENCEGQIDIRKMISMPKFNALLCHRCNLQVVIPKRIKTWNELERLKNG